MPSQDRPRKGKPLLNFRDWNWEWGNNLVRISVNWSLNETWATWRVPNWMWSYIKWKSIVICSWVENRIGTQVSCSNIITTNDNGLR